MLSATPRLGALAVLLVVPAASGQVSSLAFVDRSTGLHVPGMEGGRTEVEFADLNGDGHLDLVSVGDHGSPFVNSNQTGIMVWFGNGLGVWSHYQTGYFGYGGVALADVNNDGLMDAAYGVHHDWSSNDFGNQVLEVALGDGTGRNWTPWDDGLGQQSQSWGMFSTDLADIDNDGMLDVGSVAFGCCDGVHVYRNNGDGTWTRTFGFLGGNSSMEFQFGDFNGDGHADFAASHGSGSVYLGDGTGAFALADGNLGGGPWRSGLSIGDADGDGREEIAWATSGALHVWKMIAPGQWQNLSGNLASLGVSYHRTQIADMNLDGLGEIVAYRPGQVDIYGRDGGGEWVLLARVVTPEGCGTAAALRTGTDADHNGYPDIVTVTEENCHWWTGGTNRPRFYANTAAPEQAWVHPVYPRGGQTFIAGQTRFVRWHAAIPEADRAGGMPTMTIELSTAGPDGPWSVVAPGVPSSGWYQWLLPASLPSTSSAHLRFTLATDPPVSAVTPGAFTIIGVDCPSPDCPADWNCDGEVNTLDVLGFLNSWVDGDERADLNGDGAVNTLDVLAFLNAWTAGCDG